MARYSAEDSTRMTDEYQKDPSQETVERLAAEFDVTPRSIIAKLSSLGVYQRKRYLNKSGLPPVKKASLADQLGKMLKLHDFEIEQLEKLSKPLITKLIGIYDAHL